MPRAPDSPGKMSVFLQSSASLSQKDISLFYHPFCREINRLLPVPGDVSIRDKDGKTLDSDPENKFAASLRKKLAAACQAGRPRLINNLLVLPLFLSDEDSAVVVGGIDPVLQQRMDPDWLTEFRDDIQHALCQIKKEFIHPETGLFTSRLLEHSWIQYQEREGAFFLIGALNRYRYSSGELLKIVQTAHLLESLLNVPVFYFGGNVFGIYKENFSREQALHFSRRLLGRLKREGLRSVHVGIALIHEEGKDRPMNEVLTDCWQALETAEQRGPFSLCEVSYLLDRANHPLSQPDPLIVRRLQRAWRGMERYGLLLIRSVNGNKKKKKDAVLEQVVEKKISDYQTVAAGPDECFVLLPDVSPEKAVLTAGKLKKSLDTSFLPGQIAVGISYWPCLGFSRTASLLNCRRALMHGDFFGPGSVTLFDHISLNVSGDYFFDEGDYRQAVRDYRAGLELQKDDVNLMNSLGVTLIELNRLGEGVRYFDMVLQQDRENFMALVNKGFAMRMLQKEDEALKCLARAEACEEFPSSSVAADISLQLGRLYCDSGEYQEAVRVLEKAKRIVTDQPDCHFESLLGRAYAALGEPAKAIGLLQQAVRHNAYDAEAMSILGELYGREEQGDDIALSLCERAVGFDDRSWENWLRLARVRYRLADNHGALDAVQESLRKNGRAIDAIFLAGKIYADLGKKMMAKKMFRKIMQTEPGFPGIEKAMKNIENQKVEKRQ